VCVDGDVDPPGNSLLVTIDFASTVELSGTKLDTSTGIDSSRSSRHQSLLMQNVSCAINMRQDFVFGNENIRFT
jgi:hypothetical protein